MSDSSDSLPPYPGLTDSGMSGYPPGSYPPAYVGPTYPGGGGYPPPSGYGPGSVPTATSGAGGPGWPGGPSGPGAQWAPPAGAPRRRWLAPALGGAAVVLAAGAFLLGRGTAHQTPSSSSISTATALSALSSATTPPTNTACGGPRSAVGGTLKSVSGSTLTVTDRSGASKTVKTDSNTKITKVVKGSLADVKAGAIVTVHGTASGTTGIAADQVAILPAGTTLPSKLPSAGNFGPKAQTAGIAIGTVQNVTATSFTVSSGGTTITVTTSGSTAFSKTVSATVGQLTVGQPIAVRGTPNSDGSITATEITQADSGVAGGKLPGFGFGPGPRGRGPGSP